MAELPRLLPHAQNGLLSDGKFWIVDVALSDRDLSLEKEGLAGDLMRSLLKVIVTI
jgi:hypothetical protein